MQRDWIWHIMEREYCTNELYEPWTEESVWSCCPENGPEFQHIPKMSFQRKHWKVCTCKLPQVIKKWFLCQSETIWKSFHLFSLSLSLIQTYQGELLDTKNYSISNTFVGWLVWHSIMLLIMNLPSGCSRVAMPTSGLFHSVPITLTTAPLPHRYRHPHALRPGRDWAFGTSLDFDWL